MRENVYQANLIKKLKDLFPGCLILKNDSSLVQGIPDRVIFYKDRYAFLEIKATNNASSQPNQGYYINLLNEMSFAAFICPENEEEVLDALQRAFESVRPTRVPQRK